MEAHIKQAEIEILGRIMIDPEEKGLLSECFLLLEPEDFDDTRHASIFSAARDVFSSGGIPGWIFVAEELSRRGELDAIGGGMYLLELSEKCPTATRLMEYARILKDSSTRRNIQKLGMTIQERATANLLSVDEIITKTSESLDFIREKKTGAKECRNLFDIGAPMIRSMLDGKYNQWRETVKTGIESLDFITTGFHPGELIVIAGRPGTGKSSLALQIISNAAICQQKKGLFVSLEMSESELVDRFVANQTKIPHDVIRSGRLDGIQQKIISELWDRVGSARLHLMESSVQSADSIVNQVKLLSTSVHVDIVVVDYLQLIACSSGENRATEIGRITRTLKSLAKDMKCTVVALSQLNRNSERDERTPRLADLRESGSIEQDADTVLMLSHRKESGLPPGAIDLIIAKQRNGPTDTIYLVFDGPCLSFSERMPGF